MSQPRRGVWPAVVTAFGFLIAWELACRLEVVSPVLLSSPTRVLAKGATLLSAGAIYADLGFTLAVFALSVVVGIVAGTCLGLALGISSTIYQALNPFVVASNALPKIVLMPLIVLWVGVGMSANVLLGSIMASFPIIVSTFAGVRQLEAEYMTLARSFGASNGMIARSIVLPGVLPYVLSGLRVGINNALVGALIGEFFASDRGVGYRMLLAMSNFEVDAFFVYLCLVALFAVACTWVVQRIERWVERWRPAAFDAPGGM